MAAKPPEPPPTPYEIARSRHAQRWWYHCKSCGFLARMVPRGPDQEVPTIVRDAGMDVVDGRTYEGLYCFVNAQPIAAEFSDAVDKAHESRRGEFMAVLEVVNRDRDCRQWYPYTPGARPLWHVEDRRTTYLEELRAHREREMAGIQAEIQADHKAIAAANLDVATKLHEVTVETGNFTNRWTRINFVIAMVALGVAVLGVLIAGIALLHAPGTTPSPLPTSSQHISSTARTQP